jgi:Ala-tRNA(Pro) deacylase
MMSPAAIGLLLIQRQTTMSDDTDCLTVLARLQRRLTEAQVEFALLQHEPVFTSEEAARVRGVSLASGAKALVCKVDERFVLFVLPADRKLDSKRARQATAGSSVRFATRDEVQTITGLLPGSIPPFGSLFSLPTICDPRLADEGRINFNAGDHAISISMTFASYVQVEQPTLAQVAV